MGVAILRHVVPNDLRKQCEQTTRKTVSNHPLWPLLQHLPPASCPYFPLWKGNKPFPLQVVFDYVFYRSRGNKQNLTRAVYILPKLPVGGGKVYLRVWGLHWLRPNPASAIFQLFDHTQVIEPFCSSASDGLRVRKKRWFDLGEYLLTIWNHGPCLAMNVQFLTHPNKFWESVESRSTYG